MRSLVGAFILGIVVFSFACKKEQAGDEPDLHGAWAKGTNHGDTLWFLKKNCQHIMRIASFGPVISTYDEKEYKYKGGKLSIKSFAPSSQEYFPINSFTWVDSGKEFSITNSELFPFMSSIVTLKYRKL
ncbi:MAG TPA: hypothetical protein VF144_02400 [Chitinophagaceae bacterium]